MNNIKTQYWLKANIGNVIVPFSCFVLLNKFFSRHFALFTRFKLGETYTYKSGLSDDNGDLFYKQIQR